MKLLGFEITRSKKPVTQDQGPISVEKVALPKSADIPPAVIKAVRSPGLTYSINRNTGRGAFVPSEYDIAQIGRVEDTDAYVRQAFKKKIGLMFKEGWDLVGPNKQRIKYMKARLAQISRASSLPTAELLRSIGSALVKKSNVFLVKVRKTDASGGRLRTTPNGKDLKPIAAYFVLPAETMEVDADQFGRIRQWRQNMPNGLHKKYRPEDVVHFYFDRKEGFIFGTPTLVPVIDDIRALRKIEENVELLVYQHLFPLFHYTVGTEKDPARYTEDGLREIDVVKQEIQFMPTEGGIVTPERHKIEAIGAEGRALRIESYLDHFKKRVFSGLGVSAVDMGEGETANRATADNMSRALIDDVKDFQDVLECQFNEFIIKELLLESTFGERVLDDENLVFLKFKEIDIDKRIKVETHAADQFAKQAITWDELRESQGREAIVVPDSEEPDDMNKFPEWMKTHFKLFGETLALIQAVDEPFLAAKVGAANKNTSMSQSDVDEAREAAIQAKEREASARSTPSTQRNSITDNFLGNMFDDLEENLVFELSTELSNLNYLNLIVRAQAARMVKILTVRSFTAFMLGFTGSTGSQMEPGSLIHIRQNLERRAIKFVGRLSSSLISAISRQVDSHDADDKISVVRAVFKSLRYRTDLIVDVETRRARNLGIIRAIALNGHDKIVFRSTDPECAKCSESMNEPMEISLVTLENIPPFHGSCRCIVEADEVNSE